MTGLRVVGLSEEDARTGKGETSPCYINEAGSFRLPARDHEPRH